MRSTGMDPQYPPAINKNFWLQARSFRISLPAAPKGNVSGCGVALLNRQGGLLANMSASTHEDKPQVAPSRWVRIIEKPWNQKLNTNTRSCQVGFG